MPVFSAEIYAAETPSTSACSCRVTLSGGAIVGASDQMEPCMSLCADASGGYIMHLYRHPAAVHMIWRLYTELMGILQPNRHLPT